MNRISRIWIKGLGLISLAGNVSLAEPVPKNLYAPHAQVVNIAEGLSWPKGQAVPTFATPAASLDAVMVQDLSKDELLTFSALQGRVNRKQPRILLIEGKAEEGPLTWAETAHFSSRNVYEAGRRYELLAKYAKELDGVVLYDTALSPHYRNLACTAASQSNSVPATKAVYEEMKKAGIRLRITTDLTTLKFATPLEIYGYMHDRYWPKSEKRLIVSAKPHDEKGGGDYHHTRDIAAATGAAVVWLDTRIPAERDMLRKFFADMKAGEAIALGWYATERTGITTASEYGIGTIPSDFYVSPSIYAGTDHVIHIPAVPKKPELENKVYIAIFTSDGDNIQYTQHAMRKNWDRTAASRGKVPLNWTLSPSLVDMGPAIMNYYYSTATPDDCFVTGPSGMGYMMPTNTLTEPNAPTGESLKDPVKMDGYTRMTETYLQRSGLRVMTIWDDASPALRKAYEKNCRSLYGATVQNFKDVPSVAGSVENNRVRFDKLVVPYASTYRHISDSLGEQIRKWDGKAPLFLSYQVDVWGEMRANRLVDLHDQLAKDFPGKTEFVRADHYFNLYNEANGLPFNLAMSAKTTVTTSDSAANSTELLDGTPSTVWTASKPGKQWLGFDLGAEHKLTRCVLRHASAGALSPTLNTRDFAIQLSSDGKAWRTVAVFRGSKDSVTDIDFPPASARYVKVLIDNPGGDSVARIADVEIYGSKL